MLKQPIKCYSLYLWLFATTVSIADPPYLTDTPVPLEQHQHELYISTIASVDQSIYSFNLPVVQFNYGLTSEFEIGGTGVLAENINRDSSVDSAAGIADSQLGITYRFINESSFIPQVGIIPTINLPSGSNARGLGNGRMWWQLPLALEKNWQQWTLDGSIAYARNSAPQMKNFFSGGILIKNQLNSKWQLGAECYEVGAVSSTQAANTFVNLGVDYFLTQLLDIQFSTGHSISGPNTLISYLGIHWVW